MFHTEAELDKYFASVYAALPDEVGGMLMVDAYGGRTAHTVGRTTRTVDDCPGVKRYFRVVQDWNPTTRMCDWCIDFEDNASVVHRAFRYGTPLCNLVNTPSLSTVRLTRLPASRVQVPVEGVDR